MKDIILGAGVSGQILKYLIPSAEVFEAGPRRSHINSSVGCNYVWEPLEGFECKAVKVFTTVDGIAPKTEAIRRYKNKIGKDNENEEDWKEQFRPEQNGYLLNLPGCSAHYEVACVSLDLVNHIAKFSDGWQVRYDRMFSTLPLPIIVKLCEWNLPVETLFRSQRIYVKTKPCASLVGGQMVVNYVSSPCNQTYRETWRDQQIHEESISPYTCKGDEKSFVLSPGKIWNSPATHTILRDLEKFGNVYCFGRYASWNSDELIHQTYKKVQAFLNKGEYRG